ncbi:hypothetical protein [Burkholderia contaminans]|uniref:hypothetical protein n=1 Tax=Burkholderia contaminans TaxID=488447 RepID=UPI001588C98A|nr:hypothetical protein [Burkholderia contaminans]
MIKRPDQIKLLALGLPDVPANRSSDSSSSSAQTTNTTTNVTDRRFVNDGGGAGVAGDNNAVWNSVSTTNVSTDLGAIAGAMDLAKTGIQTAHEDMTTAAGLASQTFNKATDANAAMFGQNADLFRSNQDVFGNVVSSNQSMFGRVVDTSNDQFNKVVNANDSLFTVNNDQLSANRSTLMDGFNKLLDASKTVMQTAQDVNRTATSDVQQAYANAQEISNGQKFLVAGGLVMAGIVAITAMKGKL